MNNALIVLGVVVVIGVVAYSQMETDTTENFKYPPTIANLKLPEIPGAPVHPMCGVSTAEEAWREFLKINPNAENDKDIEGKPLRELLFDPQHTDRLISGWKKQAGCK